MWISIDVKVYTSMYVKIIWTVYRGVYVKTLIFLSSNIDVSQQSQVIFPELP